ncbi:MAG: histidine kinase [Lachnospiraceae bacterium]|nr:histidine kinase [Lachnospiraceae bacterium]
MKNKSIRSLLLGALIILTIVTLLLTTAVFSIMQYKTLKDRAVNEIQADCTSIARSLRQVVKEMDIILLYSIASRELKDDFLNYAGSESSFEVFRNRQKLSGTMISLKGFDFSTRQLNIYNMEDKGFGVGNYNGDIEGSVKERSFYEKTKERSGRKYIYAPAKDELASRAAGIDDDTLYFSICRMFYNDMHVESGFLEVKAYYDEIFDSISYTGNGMEPVIVIYDNDGRQLYPRESEYFYFGHRDKGSAEIINTNNGKKQFLCFAEDEEDGLTVAMAVDNSVFMEPVYRSFIIMIVAVIAVFAICFAIAAAISKRTSGPIRQIYAFLSESKKEGETSPRLMIGDSGIVEIDTLRDSINDSLEKQENATRSMLVLKEQEMQARMLALQSQMNPHFLYNSLSMIGEMAESGMTEGVSEMCEDITSILRYISSDREQRIRVEEEMEQVDIFLRCNKRRFGDDLKYSFDIADDVLDCMVPKLCIQLLTENAIKAVTTERPPWRIEIKGFRRDDEWYVTVSDNGPGFDPKVDRELRSNMDKILETGVLPSLKIEGMGILNIFIRLYLLDGIPFIFDFGNREEGGAFVTVGGHIHDKDRSL